MVGFVLARFQYLAIGTVFAKSSSPGEWYWYRAGFYRVGITMHLGACIPAGFLLVWQFVPWIRYHAMLFHRINGWTVSCLIIVSNVGALMIARRSFGGTVASQTSIGLLAILTTVGIGMAIYNVKRLQIDQHRAWMLRTAFWLGTIITMRLIMIISALIAAHIGTYYSVATCGEVMYVDGGSGKALYPQCWQDGATADLVVAVRAAFDKSATATQIGSSLKIGFPTGVSVMPFPCCNPLLTWMAALARDFSTHGRSGDIPQFDTERSSSASPSQLREAKSSRPEQSGQFWADS